MVHELRKAIPGRDANLPLFIVERMEHLGIRPSLRQLAAYSGLSLNTLNENLRGSTSMRLASAKKLADALDVSLDELVKEVPALLQ